MNAKDTAQGAASFVGPVALAVGAASLTVAIISSENRYGAQASQPSPHPTVTVTATAAEETPAPSPSSSRERTVVAAEPAARPTAGGGSRTAAGTGHRGGSSSGGRSSTAPRPAPGPSTSAPVVQPARCDGAVSIRLPLGVLPRCGITIGGSR